MAMDGAYFFYSIFGTIIIICAIVGLVFYVFQSVGLYTLAKRRGLRYPGLAFVPAINYWVIGSAADQYDLIYKGRNMKLRLVLLWLGIPFLLIYVVYFVLLFDYMNQMILSYYYFPTALIISYVILIMLSIVLTVFYCIALYKLYRSCSPENATVLLVLSIIFSVIVPFVLFALRKSDKGMPIQAPPAPQNGQYQ